MAAIAHVHILGALNNVFWIEAKTPNLKFETYLSFLFTSVVGLNILLLFYLVGGTMYCIPNEADATEFLANTGPNRKNQNFYIATTCATEIKWKSIYIFVLVILFLFFVAAVMYVNRDFIESINRLDAIINAQNLEQFIGNDPVWRVPGRGFYEKALQHKLRNFLLVKLLLGFLLVLFVIVKFTLQWTIPILNDLYFPSKNECGREMFWNRDREQVWRCHFGSEWAIFLIWVLLQFLHTLLVIMYFITIIALLNFWKRFHKLKYNNFPPLENIDEELNDIDLEFFEKD